MSLQQCLLIYLFIFIYLLLPIVIIYLFIYFEGWGVGWVGGELLGEAPNRKYNSTVSPL